MIRRFKLKFLNYLNNELGIIIYNQDIEELNYKLADKTTLIILWRGKFNPFIDSLYYNL